MRRRQLSFSIAWRLRTIVAAASRLAEGATCVRVRAYSAHLAADAAAPYVLAARSAPIFESWGAAQPFGHHGSAARTLCQDSQVPLMRHA
eukprot:CAMPEP_0119348916 /NCGR_PEP_ID=MMETSP1333-20130426/109288_1 /TAXON_ID=418940 /ORGANISM="Scyphosphaera apsteinii, Strain RCC1455" /LENGTH=89 /DNA_ID=CAMNT_0007361509 /DNA_START=428 /DNA_END=697 /DNA_ORIENTATION=+